MSPPAARSSDGARTEPATPRNAGRDVNSRTGCDAYASKPTGPIAAQTCGSVADYTAGYEAGYTAGYRAAMTVLDDAGAFLATTLRPSAGVDAAAARADRRRRCTEPAAPERSAREVSEYRRRVYASWGLEPPHDIPDPPANAGPAARAAGSPGETR